MRISGKLSNKSVPGVIACYSRHSHFDITFTGVFSKLHKEYKIVQKC